MEINKLKDILSKYVDINKGTFSDIEFYTDNLSFGLLRDRIIGIGRIEEENLEKQYYVIALTKGNSAFSNAMTVVKYENGTVCLLSYAIEGLIKQNIAKKNNETIKNIILGKEVLKKGINYSHLIIFVILVATTVSIISIISSHTKPEVQINSEIDEVIVSEEKKDNLLNEYNTLVANYNNVAEEYNRIVSTISTKNLSGMKEKLEKKQIITDKLNNNLNADTIENTTKDLEEALVDYKLVSQLENPTEEWVTDRIKQLEEVVDVQAATKDNDPDGILGKEGSYYSCIYFSLSNVSQEKVPGKTIIDKGTDCGGSVELYSNLEDAEKRCEYLGQFDNTLLYSGSYSLLGKMVIRTSYLLSNEEQIEITSKIVDELTKIN